MRAVLLPLALAAAAAAGGPAKPDPETIRAGLLAPGRDAREQAEVAARTWARTDPAGAAALWKRLDLRGRAILIRALASAGTRHAATIALQHAGDPEPEIFRALLVGLPDGGAKALFTPLPDDLSAVRRRALEAVRLRWRVEAELVRLKSPSGPTGHYEGQYKRIRALGPEVIPIFFDLTMDRASPIPGEGGAGPYRPIHPGMVRFERSELRDLAAHAFGEIVEPTDAATVDRLYDLWARYFHGDRILYRLEREELAPALAFGLHDLGRKKPARAHIDRLEGVAQDGWSFDAVSAMWELGYANIRIGQHTRGEWWYEQVLLSSPSKAIAAYNMACNFSMRAKREPRRRKQFKEKALEYLALAIHRYNYGDWKWMEEDGDLDFIRDEPEYQRLLKKLQRRYPERKKGKVSKKREDFLK
ncbi:MAG: TPR end-of-group domain-containing protein [Planctomycetota bacterium]